MHTVGILVLSLHRESTNSVIISTTRSSEYSMYWYIYIQEHMHPEYNSILPQWMCCYGDCALQMNYMEIVRCMWLFPGNLMSEMHALCTRRAQTLCCFFLWRNRCFHLYLQALNWSFQSKQKLIEKMWSCVLKCGWDELSVVDKSVEDSLLLLLAQQQCPL